MSFVQRRNQKLPKWLREECSKMTAVEGSSDEDIVIPVMGATGVGKSTFINAAARAFKGPEIMKVGHELQSCTSTIQHVSIPHPNNSKRRIILVDTPGFDDTFKDDVEILKLIAVWLARSYHEDMKLAGIIYMHEISQARMLGTGRKNLTMFRKLCGDKALRHVFLTTTKWGDIQLDVGNRREEQLRKSYWKDMIAGGAVLSRFRNNKDSAREIINRILSQDQQDNIIRISDELVNLQRFIPQTEAGQTLRYTLNELLEQQKKLAQQLAEDDGAETAKIVEIKEGMQSTLRQIMKLKLPLSSRILSSFGF